ncbi:MAG: peroxidase family protein, partial [Gammaproteobacteria bacterium]
MLGKLFDRLLGARPWYRLPRLLAALRLIKIRNDLRKLNLHDTEEPPFEKLDPAAADPKHGQERTLDGTYNDLAYPRMGSAGTRFGRNFALEDTRPETATLLDPNPRAVSQKLMTRHAFQPATSLNLMAASWIQFMVHDWFVHEQSDSEHIEVPEMRGDHRSGDPGDDGAMRVPRTRADPALPGSTRPPAYRNL